MKKGLVLAMVMLLSDFADATIVSYELNGLSDGSFEYVYTIENDTLTSAIEQFTIWFDEQLYNNLQVTTSTSLSNEWDEIILPSTGFGIPLGYDALALSSGIDIGQTVSSFSVRFVWLGAGLPGSQCYEIVAPATNQTIANGFTIPEPVTLLFFCISFVISKKWIVINGRTSQILS
ncbi:MAG: hypothetical protein A2Y10_13530 [Planctomycetes bacterium GWF2_41_51]|nr:MAG: hypothetical protein A2Y10_13530 [Planctomycetes bacterium GWF2_41_51]HBG26177.1 hypothetical protein [Phycisphaerales bacterium]